MLRSLSLAAVLVTALALTGGAYGPQRTTLATPVSGYPASGYPAAHDNHAHGHRKPGAEVYLTSRSINTIQLQREEALTVALRGQLGRGELQVEVRTDSGLALLSGQRHWRWSTAGRTHYELPLTVYASEAGAHRVHIFTRFVDASGHSSARAFAISARAGLNQPVVVHDKHRGAINAAPAFVTLPAREVIE